MLKKLLIKSTLNFAKTNLQHDDDYFRKILLFDLIKFEVFGHNDETHVWIEDGAACCHKNTIPNMNHGCGNIMVCGCFAYSGTEEPIIIGNTMKSSK